MRKFMIERDIPSVGKFSEEELRGAATTSNDALDQLGTDIQWQFSFVTGDKTFCVYLAENEALIRRHSELSGFPANQITEIFEVIDPSTATGSMARRAAA